MPHDPADYSFTNSPGDGITPVKMSPEPLATEGEATPGPDDWNPYEEMEARQEIELVRERKKRRERERDVPPLLPSIFDNGGRR